ncbi:MAG: 2-oxoglutarate ferredoxin oxidoreductase subunit alpha [Phycisphaeraceae bacterium]|nr:2-oxoglutarate ferredoxin oxidoreductase subunit alpha [Phycisphaeraceae bacterium]
MSAVTKDGNGRVETREVGSAVVFFAGDSGDGMQLAGSQFTDTSAVIGNDVATLPDYPAEIRAPAGTVAGVSGFQINFADKDIHTPGDEINALIAMNPAAFRAHIDDVEPGGIVVVNDSEFNKVNLRKAGYPEAYNPLEDEKYAVRYKIFRVPITRLNSEALAESGMGAKDIGRCKNMFALGLVYWLYDRPITSTVNYLDGYFGRIKKLPKVAAANVASLKAGFYFGETAEMFPVRFQVSRAAMVPGRYRKVSGNEALAMGLVTAAHKAERQLVYCSYPITPASDILHSLATMRHFGVKTFQAEDEIAAVCAAIGASYAGQIGVTGTSGPGLALKSEAINLAVVAELPLIVVDVQRGGPSTGLPTKTEQADLLQAMFGRNSDSPLVVLAPRSPADCFQIAIEAASIATRYMVPVLILSDGYIGNGAEPWLIPDPATIPRIEVARPSDPEGYEVYGRNDHLARPWAVPGTPGFEHRVGGLEKQHVTGNVSYDAENHQFMTVLRREKVQRVASGIPPVEPLGAGAGDLLLVGWGGTYGAITTAVNRARKDGKSVAAIHLRHLNPLPPNFRAVLEKFKRVLVPELNTGQLRMLIRSRLLVDARGLNKIQGKPFLVEEIEQAIDLMLSNGFGDRESMMPHEHLVREEDQHYDFSAPIGKHSGH